MQTLTEEQQTMVEDNIRLAYFIANKWHKQVPIFRFDIEELRSLCSLGLCKAARAYDKKRGIKFATFAARCMDNEVLMVLRKDKERWRLISIEQSISTDTHGNELTILDIIADPKDAMEEWAIKESIPALMEALTEREQIMINRIFLQREGQRVIGIDMGLSQSYVSRIRVKALKTMRKEAMKDQVAWF